MSYRYVGILLFLLMACFSAKAQTRKPKTVAPNTLFQGIWAVGPNENAEFEVRGSRLTYVEFPDTPVRYRITPTTLTIFNEDGPSVCRIRKLTKDSLVYVTSGGFTVRLYKRR
ncbi:hypothetical protein [Hymenobacter metallilatus]|uniref:DUF3471 domain-containing protein n=1 Tax=Hymenobacter metallilatus TaxID=2493666 RepID=A0A428JF14_9BACT|nr:hypothetical protein [Hymenobacter metallilatus]RSK31199.1 hypothetical protein EI290_14360 [Hymenobacter metallilatus]